MMWSNVLAVSLLLSIISIMGLPRSTEATVHSLPEPIFEPLDHIYNLTIANQSYPIRYGFSEANSGAVVESMSADYASKSIKVVVNDNLTSADKRYFIIELPRNVINANTTEIAGGCTAAFQPGSGIPPAWVQEHDLDYTAIVSIKTSEGEVAIYNGNLFQQCGRDTRVLSIEYLGGGSTIIIQGTTMIPEFGSIAMVVAAAAVIGVVIVGKRTFYQKQ